MENLASKYRPKKLEDIVEQNVVVDILKNMSKADNLSSRCFLFIGPAGTGKAQPMYSKVLTPHGFIQMKDVHIGTEVFTAKGNIAKVSDIFPQRYRPIYEITLSDNTSIRVADNHLNCVYYYDKYRKHAVVDTMSLINLVKDQNTIKRSPFNHIYIDIPSVDWDEKPCSLDPYLMGVLLMKGIFNYETNEVEIRKINGYLLDNVTKILKGYGYELVESSQSKFRISLIHEGDEDIIVKKLDAMGIMLCTALDDMFIPKEYLYNSKYMRYRLFLGMFDACGRVEHGSHHLVIRRGEKLSHDFEFLVRSLGIRDSVRTQVVHQSADPTRRDTIRPCHRLKSDNLKLHSVSKYSSHKSSVHAERYITSITYIGDEECQCIMVDHPDHTYISDNFIPTHNTTTARALATLWNGVSDGVIEIDAASNNGVDAMREIVQQASTYPINTSYKIFILDECHVLSNTAWQILLKPLEEQPAKTIFMLCTTNPEKIPATILSRVQTFQLSKISLKGIHDRLKYVLDHEIAEGRSITYTDDAITYIAKLANGGMRDALTTLDKALSYSEDVKIENLEISLSLPNFNDYFTLLNAIVRKNNNTIIQTINDVYNSGVNFVKWFEGFHSFLCNIVKYIFLRDISLTMIPSTYEEKISVYGPSHSAFCLQLSNKLVKLIADLKRTQYLQEYAITYLCDSTKK